MIRTEGLTRRFGAVTAVNNLNLHVQPGEIYGFLGPNGAGKTTTIRLLLQLLHPSSGRVWLFGQPLPHHSVDIKRRLGVLSEFHYLYEDMTAEEYLQFFASVYGVARPQRAVRDVLDRVGLLQHARVLLSGYSKGMKQKLSLARCLLHNPDLFIFDEPVSALDPHGIKQVRDIILEENQKGKTFFISSHILSEVERTCHRVGIMNKGRLVAEGDISDIKRSLAGTTVLSVELESPLPHVEDALRKTDFVQDITVEHRYLTVHLRADGDYRGAVSRLLVKMGGVIVGMRGGEVSLEQAFMTLTEDNTPVLMEEGEAV